MFRFAHPDFLYLLFILPMFMWLFVRKRQLNDMAIRPCWSS